MTLNPTIKVSVAQIMGTKPGDRCPDTECLGTIEEIVIRWTEDFFSGDAKCNLCGETWCIAEEVVGDEDDSVSSGG